MMELLVNWLLDHGIDVGLVVSGGFLIYYFFIKKER